MQTILTGTQALEYAERNDVLLNKYNDPTEDAREGLTLSEARKIAMEDPGLIYVAVEIEQADLTDRIQAAVAEILRTGNSAPKLYLRVRPNGDVDVCEETSWCCSPEEYYKRVPHTLSLEVLASARDYSSLTADEIEACADAANDGAYDIVQGWQPDIAAWIAAGNYQGSNSHAS